jgi:hypothetical protein
MGKREWDELQLDRLVTILDRTKTAFGRWGLVKLLQPIASKYQLDQRKKIITFLLDNPEIMQAFQNQLEHMRKGQGSLLAYWDKHDVLNKSCERFYFVASGLHGLNKSGNALNASTIVEGFNTVKDLLKICAMWGLSNELFKWSLGVKEEFDWWSGIKEGLTDPLMHHSPWLYKLGQGPYKAREVAQAISWGDKCNAWRFGFSYGGPNDDQNNVPGVGIIGGAVMATATTLFYDYQWVNAIDFMGRRLVSMYRDLNKLQQRVSDVAHCVKSIKNLQKLIALQGDEFSHYFDLSDDDYIELFIKKLLHNRFVKKPGYLYSRGHVLAMHQDVKRTKRSLVPLLHSIALLDAYCSIAQLYKESQNQGVVFSFPEFIESPTPLVCYDDAWLPLLPADEAITNNLMLGGDQPGKIVITGPNGGGKSTILKTYGIAAVLAQSWCIVPAAYAQQTLFTTIRTALATHEDLSKRLSTWMAEKKVMQELLDNIAESDEERKIIVLIDEPYKGTVEDESAKRIYQFGKDIAEYPSALVALATHVKRPIVLERETHGIFGNYQIKIREKSLGIFERLFKIEKGPAVWWFEDENQRSRFVDWIG